MSCLYRSLSYFHNSIATEQLRQMICDYLATDPELGGDKASNIIKWETGKNLTDYIRHMRSQTEWGGAIEIKAYCDLLDRNVKILLIANTHNQNRKDIDFFSNKNKENINQWDVISWNGYHYEPVKTYQKTNDSPISKDERKSRLNSKNINNLLSSSIKNKQNNENLPKQSKRCNCINCQRKRLRQHHIINHLQHHHHHHHHHHNQYQPYNNNYNNYNRSYRNMLYY